MANVLLTPQMLTRGPLFNLGGYLNIARNLSNDYSNEFGNEAQKIGSTLGVRKPPRFTVTPSMGYVPNPVTQTKTPITVDQWSQVSFEFDSTERTLSISKFQEDLAKPVALAIASDINAKCAKYVALNTANAVGTPGTTPTTVLTYLQAGDRLTELGLPEGEELTLVVSRKMSSALLNANTALFNPSDLIGQQFKTGVLSKDQLGYKVTRDQSLYSTTFGTYTVAGVVDGPNQQSDGGNNGYGTLVTKTWTACALKAGDRFTIANVYSTHPQTHQSTGTLQAFTLISDSASATAPTLSIYPAITPSGQFQNVTAAPADNAVITMLGTTGVAHTQGLLFHRDAYAFLSVKIDEPQQKGVEMVSQERDPETGMWLRFTRSWDGRASSHINRYDGLWGTGGLYKELACAIYSGI